MYLFIFFLFLLKLLVSSGSFISISFATHQKSGIWSDDWRFHVRSAIILSVDEIPVEQTDATSIIVIVEPSYNEILAGICRTLSSFWRTKLIVWSYKRIKLSILLIKKKTEKPNENIAFFFNNELYFWPTYGTLPTSHVYSFHSLIWLVFVGCQRSFLPGFLSFLFCFFFCFHFFIYIFSAYCPFSVDPFFFFFFVVFFLAANKKKQQHCWHVDRWTWQCLVIILLG